MKVALIASYEALIDGIAKAAAHMADFSAANINWNQTNSASLERKLSDIQAAEQELYVSTHVLSERISAAEAELADLNTALGLLNMPAATAPAGESSFRYSTSMSSSGDLSWKYNSGSLFVTADPKCSVPDKGAGNGVFAKKGKGRIPTRFAAKKVVKKPVRIPVKKAVKKGVKKGKKK